jgi:hypothetical protein
MTNLKQSDIKLLLIQIIIFIEKCRKPERLIEELKIK